ncbi:MAG: hypothetical protein ACK5LO_05080 [Leucobacter sp.]
MADHANSSAPAGELFQRPEQPRAGFGSILLFIVCAVLLFGGFYVMSLAFEAGVNGTWIFVAGLAANFVACFLAFGISGGKN